MARTQAKILTSIWTDPEFTALPLSAQRLYILLLGQPRLSLAGLLDVMLARWASLAADSTPDTMTADLATLEQARFVVLDDDELVVRSFTKNDLWHGSCNANLIKGMWSSWAQIRSRVLRKVVVDNLPSDLLAKHDKLTPDEARELLAEPRLELPLEPRFEPSVALLLTPVACLPSPDAVAASIISPLTSVEPEPLSDDDIEQATRKAIGILARMRSVGANDPGAYARTVGANLDPVERDELREQITAGKTPDEAAAYVADPFHGITTTGLPNDPAEAKRIARIAREREAATAKVLADIRAVPDRIPLAELRKITRPAAGSAS